jgi:hypothetical protein
LPARTWRWRAVSFIHKNIRVIHPPICMGIGGVPVMVSLSHLVIHIFLVSP